MKATVTLQIASKSMSLLELATIMGYSGAHLVTKGTERTPPRQLPDANLWSGSSELVDVWDADQVVVRCLEKYRDAADRMRLVRKADPEAKCTLHLGLRPYRRDFALFFERETVQRLADLGCELDIEYFDD
jgi:hypothetical protein